MKDYFITVPSWAIKSKLKGYDLLIYCLIYGFTSVEHSCYLSYKSIAELVGCSEKQVRRCLDRLISVGSIVVSDKGFVAMYMVLSSDEPLKDKMSLSTDKMSHFADKMSWDAALDDMDKYCSIKY